MELNQGSRPSWNTPKWSLFLLLQLKFLKFAKESKSWCLASVLDAGSSLQSRYTRFNLVWNAVLQSVKQKFITNHRTITRRTTSILCPSYCILYTFRFVYYYCSNYSVRLNLKKSFICPSFAYSVTEASDPLRFAVEVHLNLIWIFYTIWVHTTIQSWHCKK